MVQSLKERMKEFIKPPISLVQIVKYAGASGDYNKIHIDHAFAMNTPQKGIIAHGMLSMGFLGQYLDNIAGEEYNVKQFKVRFRGMVRPGDQLTCSAAIDKDEGDTVELEIFAKNQDGEIVTLGNATLIKTDERERN